MMIGESPPPCSEPRYSSDISRAVDIMAFIKDNPPPATIILISGDRDFSYLLSTLRWRKYNVVLICNSFMTHESLTAQASVAYDWQSDILKARPSTKPSFPRARRETLSSVAPPTTPQESDSFPESEVRVVGPPNEHFTSAFHPLAPPPRPVSLATISTTHPRHVTPPPGAPLAEPEVTPVSTEAEITVGVEPASIPGTPTSDDLIASDSASESDTVRLSFSHGFVADLGFPQEQSSPEAVDPAEEDEVYSPAFVSECARIHPGKNANSRI